MSNTLSDLTTYLQLLNLDNKSISNILNRKDVVIYGLLRDKLTYSELLELQIILKDIYHHQDSIHHVDFSKYIKLTKSEIKKIASILQLRTNTIDEIATIIQMTPQELAFNIVGKN